MKRDLMLLDAVLGQLLQSPDPMMSTTAIAQRLNMELPVILHHVHLLQDRGLIQEMDSGVWRLTDQGHNYLDGPSEQGITLSLPT